MRDPSASPRPAARSLLARLLGLYLLLSLALPLLRLAHCWPVATTSWARVTGPLWLPWALLLAGAGLRWLVHKVRGSK